MGLNSALTDAAASLAASINSGQGSARANLGGGGTAFGWQTGLVRTIASYCTVAEASGMTFPVTLVTESATPAAIVPPLGLKPLASQIQETEIALKKHAGRAEFSLESQLNASGLASAIAGVLGGSALKSFEADAIAVLTAGAGETVTGTTWVEAVANGQAALLGNGAVPSVVVVSAADYGSFVTDILGTSAFAMDADSAVGSLLGSTIHVSPTAPAGTAFVFDSSAVIAVQHEASPLIIIDGTSKADVNVARLVVDLIAGSFVASPPGVAKVTAPVVGTTTARKAK